MAVGPARPVDLVFLIYVVLTGSILAAFGWRLSSRLWIGLTGAHVLLAGAGLWLSRQPTRGVSPAGFIRDAYPFLFIPFLYWELRYLAQLFSRGYRDALVQRWEELLFGGQLALEFSEALPHLWLSELMHLFYASYWVLLPVALAALYLRRRITGFRELVFVELVLFFGCYLIYIFFPVAGPFYGFPSIGGALAEGPFYRLVHTVLADGGSRGAAFPSSHVAVAVGIVLVSRRHDRTLFVAMTPVVAGLAVGTVYGRFHYAVDALAGVLFALVMVPVARWLRERMRGWTSAARAGQRPERPTRLNERETRRALD